MTEILTAEPLLPESSAFEVEMGIDKLKRHRSPSTDQIWTKLIKERVRKIRLSSLHWWINSVWKKEELPGKWKELVIVPIYKEGDKRDCSSYRGILFLPNTYKILSNILLSRLTPYAAEIVVDH